MRAPQVAGFPSIPHWKGLILGPPIQFSSKTVKKPLRSIKSPKLHWWVRAPQVAEFFIFSISLAPCQEAPLKFSLKTEQNQGRSPKSRKRLRARAPQNIKGWFSHIFWLVSCAPPSCKIWGSNSQEVQLHGARPKNKEKKSVTRAPTGCGLGRV